MSKNVSVFQMDTGRGRGQFRGTDISIIGLNLDIFENPLNIQMGVSDKLVTLADIVPLARALCEKITCKVLEEVRSVGHCIPCAKGCAACCRYIVPLSVPEAFQLRNEVLLMPAGRRDTILRSWLRTAKYVLKNNPQQLKDEIINTQHQGNTNITDLGRWYAELKLDCPFLANGICTIYKRRPIACREHMVVGSATLCEGKDSDNSRLVQMPVRILEALGQLAADVEDSEVEAVMLPLALAWSEQNKQRSVRRWPAPFLVERLSNIITAASQPEFAPATVQAV